MSEKIYIHIDLAGTTYFVGRLWVHERKGIERSTFEYSREWQSLPFCFALEPALSLGNGRHHTQKPLFGSISDSAPDRWGRALMKRRESRMAKIEERKARNLKESDYLLQVNDKSRQGALRFSMNKNGPFMAECESLSIPPLINLKNLLNASARIVNRAEKDQDLRDIVEPGSSLGGARPKASVADNDELLIAKFPSPKDEWDVEIWEFISLQMARRVGMAVPGYRLEKVDDKKVLLLERFDRQEEQKRIPFLSAMGMLNASDGETGSYLEIGESLIEFGAEPEQDLIELWRRIVFNIMVSNVDDHLRNHGFLYSAKSSGWRLSPVYDLEPTPEHVKARFLRTNIDLNNNMASLDLAYEVASDFGLKNLEAREISKKIADVVKNWRKEANLCNVPRQEIELMSTAFEHEDLYKALKDRFVSGSGSISSW